MLQSLLCNNAVDFVTHMRRIKGSAMTFRNRTTNSSQKGLQDGWTRDTFIIRKDYLEKIRALAYWERKKIKDVLDEALGFYLKGKKVRSSKSG